MGTHSKQKWGGMKIHVILNNEVMGSIGRSPHGEGEDLLMDLGGFRIRHPWSFLKIPLTILLGSGRRISSGIVSGSLAPEWAKLRLPSKASVLLYASRFNFCGFGCVFVARGGHWQIDV